MREMCLLLLRFYLIFTVECRPLPEHFPYRMKEKERKKVKKIGRNIVTLQNTTMCFACWLIQWCCSQWIFVCIRRVCRTIIHVSRHRSIVMVVMMVYGGGSGCGKPTKTLFILCHAPSAQPYRNSHESSQTQKQSITQYYTCNF